MIDEIKKCRVCNNKNLIDVINLGNQQISSRFPKKVDEYIPEAPLILCKCHGDENCNLLQLKHTIINDELYKHEYGYRSGINTTMKNHIKSLVEYIENNFIENNDVVLDIGSNDATLLKFYKNITLNLVGIDPTGNQFREYYTKNIKLIPDYFSKNLYNLNIEKKAKVITSLSMFYDLPDPVGFSKDIKDILDKNGIWIMEQSYLPTMLEKFSFDTICHEHLEYYSYKQIEYIANLSNLKIINVELNDCNGGSFRLTLTHNCNNNYTTNYENINKIKLLEEELNLNSLTIYNNFMNRCNDIKHQLNNFLKFQHSMNRKICIYGASTKGNTLLQYFEIDNKIIDAIAERNVNKYGKFTPKTLIPIKSEYEVRKMNPDFMIVLPWHFKNEFLIREKNYLDLGGQFIFPLPYLDIVSNHEKILITGSTGQIGTYLLEQLKDKDNTIIYGIVNNKKPIINSKNIFYIKSNLEDDNSIENIINMLMKYGNNKIYNLAGVTDAQFSVLNPEKTMKLNTILPIKICETILKINKNIKFFQSSSSEIFKGHGEMFVNDISLFNPINPYGISKISSSYFMKYYRDIYNLFCCSGIIFNTESHLRNENFLTKKITKQVYEIKNGIRDNIKIGNINMSRDWIHAYDVSTALIKILDFKNPDDYIISLSESNTIKEFINIAFKKINIKLIWKDDGAYDSINDKKYIIFDDRLKRNYEKNVENIIGDNSKLLKIGWVPKYNLEEIIHEMIDNQKFSL